MKNIYKAYTRRVNQEELYFVKKYIVFDNMEGEPLLLESMGMHVNFYKACKLANISSLEVIEELSAQVDLPLPETKEFIFARVSNSILRNAHHFLAKLRLIPMNSSV